MISYISEQSFLFYVEWVKKKRFGRTKYGRKAHVIESIINSDAFAHVSRVRKQCRKVRIHTQGQFGFTIGVLAVFNWGVFHVPNLLIY